MTSAQLDHLRAIDAHLERLLAIAAKRTPGKWKFDGCDLKCGKNALYDMGDYGSGYSLEDADAAYIAACSNNAEAGWKATRAAIEELRKIAAHTPAEEAIMAGRGLNAILAAFPLELVTP